MSNDVPYTHTTILYLYFQNFGRLLTLPNDTRARHKMTSSGRTEAMKIHPVHLRLLQSIVVRMGHLAEICETLKQEGLPPNEVRLFMLVTYTSLRY